MTLPRPNVRRVFVDASAFVALSMSRDQFHGRALAIQFRLVRAGTLLFTTNFILAEVHAMLVSRQGHLHALSTLREIDRGDVTITRVTEQDESNARILLGRYRDKSFSLTDALSFVVMEDLGITTAFSFDDDFAQYGFATL
jgi:predicted nucleic acid-binding protein